VQRKRKRKRKSYGREAVAQKSEIGLLWGLATLEDR
jgi:hypothetical protein